MSCQVLPLLPVRWYWALVELLITPKPGEATSSAVSLVGEKGMPLPAPTTIVPLVALFDFQTSCTV